jgi:hypothetical protein
MWKNVVVAQLAGLKKTTKILSVDSRRILWLVGWLDGIKHYTCISYRNTLQEHQYGYESVTPCSLIEIYRRFGGTYYLQFGSSCSWRHAAIGKTEQHKTGSTTSEWWRSRDCMQSATQHTAHPIIYQP